MDKVFKKILEGLEIFDTLYERHENASGSQKDKLENDLKKEIKKLQRFREQVKNWQAANEIKDKDQLLEHRRLVEIAMEKYKVVEKGSKTKAYSDQSLAAVDTPTIDNEAIEFVKQSLDSLQQQIESVEAEIEKLQPSKKGKKNVHNEEQKKEFEELLKDHHWHTEKLEIVLRLLQNEILSVDDVMNISEDITYYLDENRSPDFMFDDTIYDELDLDADQALINDIHVIPEESSNSPVPESSPIPETSQRSRSIGHQTSVDSTTNSNSRSSSAHVKQSHGVSQSNVSTPSSISAITKNDSIDISPVIQSIGTSSNNQTTLTTLKPAPVPQTSELKWSSIVTAKKKESVPADKPAVNSNALNAVSVLEELKKQKPKDLTDTQIDNNVNSLSNKLQQESGISEENSAPATSYIQPDTAPSSSDSSNPVIQNKTISSASTGLTSINFPAQLPPTDNDIGIPNTQSAPESFVLSANDVTDKSHELGAATDGFRFLPPGIQSFIISISSSKNKSNSFYDPFQSINYTPNNTYPVGLKAIHLAESWNRIKISKDLRKSVSELDYESLFFGYYYGRSIEERNVAHQLLTEKGWKQEKSGRNWLFSTSAVSHPEGFSIGDYTVFNVDKWSSAERRNARVENNSLI